MTMVSFGDLAQSSVLRRHSAVLKLEMQRRATELVTGQVIDTAARVSGDLVPISGIDATLARLESYGAVTSEATLFASVMQTALATVDGEAANLSLSLFAATTGSATARVDDVAAEARQKLDTVLSALNSRVGDRAVFSGTKTDTSAVCDADTLLSALESAADGATSAADVEAAVSAWFDAPMGFASLGYQGGAPLAALAVAGGEVARLDITANDPSLRDTLKGLAMASLLDRGILPGETAARQDLARRAGTILLENQSDRAQLAGRLGVVEAQLDAAATRNSAESAGLQMARNDITAADPYDTATRLTEAQGQLEKIYAITARMSRLSLLDYL